MRFSLLLERISVMCTHLKRNYLAEIHTFLDKQILLFLGKNLNKASWVRSLLLLSVLSKIAATHCFYFVQFLVFHNHCRHYYSKLTEPFLPWMSCFLMLFFPLKYPFDILSWCYRMVFTFPSLQWFFFL